MATEQQPPVLSTAALERLRTELEELTTTGRREVAERLLRARELGDISENAEYEASKDEQGHLEARIRYLEWTIRNAVVQDTPVSTDVAGPGMVVTLRALDDDDTEDEQYLLAASKEERAAGKRTITTASPLGQAVTGRKVGDKVSFEAPGGKFHYQILAFEPWDGR